MYTVQFLHILSYFQTGLLRVDWNYEQSIEPHDIGRLIKGLELQIEKYLKRRSAAFGLQHHAYSVKRCLYNQLE